MKFAVGRQLSRQVFALFVANIVGFYCVDLLNAEPLPPTAIPANPPSPAPTREKTDKPKELAQLQADVAESTYNARKSDRNLSALIEALERLIVLYCMPDLFGTLQYQGLPQDPTCLKNIEAALVLDVENPAAICAREGIDSKSCEDAFASQETAVFSSGFPIWLPEENSIIDLDMELATRTVPSAAMQKMETDLVKIEREAARAPPKSRAELAPRLRNFRTILIEQACRTAKTKIETPIRVPSNEGEDVLNLGPGDPRFDQYFETLTQVERENVLQKTREASRIPRIKPEVEPSPAFTNLMDDVLKVLRPAPKTILQTVRVRSDGVRRTRFVSDRCDNLIKRTLTSDPFHAAALCARHSDIAPECIKARRQERIQIARERAPRPTPGSTPQPTGPNSNFSTF